VIDSEAVDCFLRQLDYTKLREEELYLSAYAAHHAIQDHAERYAEYLGNHPINIIYKTLENTTQLATAILHFPLRCYIKS
jgi:hypothetical protein